VSQSTDKLVSDYLENLNADLRGLPTGARREVIAEIEEHIEVSRAEVQADDEAALRELLERIGDPDEIAADARERFGVRPARRTWVEVLALVLLPVGGVIIPVFGWVVGVILLWISEVWTTRDKILGTLIVPGGLAYPVYAFFAVGGYSQSCTSSFDANGHLISKHCSGGPSTWDRIGFPILITAMAIGTIAMTIHLARRTRASRSALAT
jgi:uncharacterized membrane protein